MHIGSQITALEPFRDAFALLTELVGALEADGHAIEFVNLGGGLGIPYRWDVDAPPEPQAYAEVVAPLAGKLKCRLLFEPGRMIAGNAGILVTRVIYTKAGAGKNFVIVDAGMNDLIRPTLYDAYHDIWPVRQAAEGGTFIEADVVGPVCETGDFLAKGRRLPQVQADDLLAVMTAGAYGAAQSSTYNSRPLVPEVLVSGSNFAVIRERPSYEDMLQGEELAPWLRHPVLEAAE
jgi:diaminopimelate decarboxylase